MLRSRDRRNHAVPGLRLAGMRTAWRTLDDGEFFCTVCGGDRGYRLRAGRRRFTLLGVPLVPRGTEAPVVECAACRHHLDTSVLDVPTTHRLSGMLRDAVHAVALAALAAGGTDSRDTLDAAVEAVRLAGYPECTEERLLAQLADLSLDPRLDTPSAAARAGAEDARAVHPSLCEALAPLAPHLAAAGREALLTQGAAIALADGPYEPTEREMLEAVGRALTMHPADTERVLAAARAPF